MLKKLWLGLVVIALSGCACSDNRKPEANKDKSNSDKQVAFVGAMGSVKEAVVNVEPVGDSKITGTIKFTKVSDGVRVIADVDGLKPGEHGFHVHEHGDCGGKEASAAGAHFNPTNKKHGGPDSPERHVGDLGNIVADQNGHGHYDRIDKIIQLEGENSIIGRSIIIHADRDDFVTQPTGASGARIGCGEIEAVK